MSKETSPTTDKRLLITLIELYDDLKDLTDYTFFFCDALEGMLIPEMAPERESISGLYISTQWMRTRSRSVVQQLRAICDRIREDSHSQMVDRTE
jgi:hypothetical protein